MNNPFPWYDFSYYLCTVRKQRKDMIKALLSEKEFDLIEAIRNYKKSYPNGYPEIRWYIEKLFNELIAEAENDME